MAVIATTGFSLSFNKYLNTVDIFVKKRRLHFFF